MQFKKYSKQRGGSIQGLRSLKDTLPTNVRRVINKRGQIYSETLNNWRYIAGEKLFKVCYPKSFKNTNKFNEGTLLIMVHRGHEVELEYSKQEVMDRMNSFFKNEVVKRIKFKSFNDENKINDQKIIQNNPVTNKKYRIKLKGVKNDKIKNSLIELTKVFKKK